MEQEAEREEFRIQSERMPLERKIRRGVCWWPVRAGRSYYNSLNQLVVEIENLSPAASEDDETGADTLLEYGKPIQFFQPPAAKDGKTKYLSFNSTISYVEGNRMVVTVPSADCIAELSTAERLGLQLYFDETSYRTMTRALDDVINGKGKRMQELLKVFGGLQAARQLTIKPMSFPWLNPTQEKAVNEVLRAKDVAVVHGPPGTGKTTTLVEAIYETLHRETQVLVCAWR